MAKIYNTTNSNRLERIADSLLTKGKLSKRKKTNKKIIRAKIQTKPKYDKQVSEYYKSIDFIKHL